MAEVKVEERLISGNGLVRFPPLETAVRYVSVLFDVIRQPTVIDKSFKYSPPRQRYATLTFLRDGYVIDEQALNYARRRYDFVLDPSGQTLLAVKCAHKGSLEYYTNLSAAIAPAATVPSNSISEFPNLSMLWDEIQVCCHVDTALQVRVFTEVYEECGDPYNEKSPPPPPDPLPEVPPGTPIGDISDPYPDDDVTDPYPGDEFPPPPVEEGTWIITVTIAGGGTADLGSYPGQSTDTFTVVTPSPACILAGSSDLIRNGTDPIERPLNCNSAGFVSEIVDAVFTPAP